MRRLLLVVLALFATLVVALVVLAHVQATRRLGRSEAARQASRAHAQPGEQALRAVSEAARVLESPGDAVGEGPGCQLRWVAEHDERVKKHVARCGQVAEIPAPVVQKLQELKADLLARVAEVPAFTASFEWMTRLRDHGDWTALEGTPYDFVDATSPFLSAEAPMPDCARAVLLAKLRLVAAERAGALDEGRDVVAFAKALLGAPLPNTCGVRVLRTTRELFAAASRSDALLPSTAEVDAVVSTRQAASQAWHPWVVPEFRKQVLASVSPTARCVAAFNGLFFADFGDVVDARYPGLRAEFETWARGACASPAFTRAMQAPRPPDGPERVLFSAFGPEYASPLAGVLVLVPAQRAAMLEDRLTESRPALFGADGHLVR
ncbi:MAG: hypothetical protein JNJ54_02220 [Myxococcaceae bacterium]|nr:hypothetical protein [Myxococcaceae bacterium]